MVLYNGERVAIAYELAVAILALATSASAFAPQPSFSRASTAVASTPPFPQPPAGGEEKHIGSGGMADTRDPEAKDDEDPRKSISAAPSFEEYLKQRQAGQ